MRKPRFSEIVFVVLVSTVGVANLLASQWVPTAGEGAFVRRSRPAPMSAEQRAAAAADERAMKGGRFHKPLRRVADFPGIVEPELHKVDEVRLPGETMVVGVEVDGVACAFVLGSMQDPTQHIVNTMINNKPISVTYCNYINCVRVLSDDSETSIPLNVGGLDIDNQMVLRLHGERYGQESRELPLADYPFARMSLDEWTHLHADTQVCNLPVIQQQK